MTYIQRNAVLAAVMLVHGAVGAQPVQFSDLLLRIQTEPPRLLLQHCAETAPETKEELDAAYETYKAKFAEAAESFFKEVPTGALEADTKLANRFISELGAATLKAVKGLDPQSYCKWLAGSLRSSTTEKLKSTMRVAYDRYAELAKSGIQAPVPR
jgi:hypothetical protein